MKTCKVEDCEKKSRYNGYCSKHASQIRRHGKILEKTRFDKNELMIVNNNLIIQLYNKDFKPIKIAVADPENFNKIASQKWCCFDRYVGTTVNYKIISMHIYLFGYAPENYEWDHKNRNGYDNRKDNLRICTRRQNAFNVGMRSNNTSGYTCIHRDRNKWRVRVDRKHIGRFSNLEDAIHSRDKEWGKVYGEFIPTML